MKINFPTYKSSIVELKGGINENVSSLELLAGELISCKNYMISESTYGGYTSVKGYERYDADVTPSLYESYLITVTDSALDIVPGEAISSPSGAATALKSHLVSGSFALGTAKIIIEALKGAGAIVTAEVLSSVGGAIGNISLSRTLIGGTFEYFEALNYARTLVKVVPGEGPLLGVHIFSDKIYAFRKKVGTNFIGFYVEATSNWLEIDTSVDPIVYSGGHNFKFTNNNFYATTGLEAMYWVDGVNKCRSYNVAAGVATITNTGMGALDKPILIAAHNDYLFLGYRGGSLQYSVLGAPADWSTPGEIGVGEELTNLIAGVKGSLIIYMENSTKVLAGAVEADFSLETFSKQSGGRWNTAQRAFGTVYVVDDRGLTTLTAVDAYGDYAANSLSQKFKRSLFKSPIVNTTVSRDMNQYRVFLADGSAVFVSFNGTELKGATTIEYNRVIGPIASGDINGEATIVFGSDTGFLYKMDSGTSFDGEEIFCAMSTPYFHYGSPRNNKALKRATVEVRGGKDQVFATRVFFDYSELDVTPGIWNETSVYSDGILTSIWGVSIWGDFVWGKMSEATNRLHMYLQGVGTNFSYRILSRERYRPQHTIQNIISDYEVIGRSI